MWAEKFTTEYARPDTTAVTKDQHKAGKHTTMLRAWFEQHLGEWVTQTEILRMLGIRRHTAEPFLTPLPAYTIIANTHCNLVFLLKTIDNQRNS